MDRFIVRKEKLDPGHWHCESCEEVEGKQTELKIVGGGVGVGGQEAQHDQLQTKSLLSQIKRRKEDQDVGYHHKKPRQDSIHHNLKKSKISGENLDCDYMILYSRKEADTLLQQCEETLEYFTGDLAKVKVYGKWHDIPRKQVAHGDLGVTYRYSGITVPAKPWTPLLSGIRDRIQEITGFKFNFVLINRYADGNNYMGEHRDDEKDLVATSPIASLSLGQHRDFVFRHGEARGARAKRKIPPVKVELQHGSLLVMSYPTNVYWYHSLPVRKRALNTRVNMTFRDIAAKLSNGQKERRL